MKKKYDKPVVKITEFAGKDVLNDPSILPSIFTDGYDVMQGDFFTDAWFLKRNK